MTFGRQMFLVEYHDVREAQTAYKSLNNRTLLGALLRLSESLHRHQQDSPSTGPGEVDLASPQRSTIPLPQVPDSPSPSRLNVSECVSPLLHDSCMCVDCLPLLTLVRIRPRSVSASESMVCPDAMRRFRRDCDSPLEGRRPSWNESLFFDPIENVRIYLPA